MQKKSKALRQTLIARAFMLCFSAGALSGAVCTTAMAARLPADQFMRLHRTVLARRSAVRSLQVRPDGSHLALLSNGELVRVSDSRVRDVQALFT